MSEHWAELPIVVRRAGTRDAAAIARLIEPAFQRFIAPALGDAGRVAFRLFVTEKALRIRLARNAVAWCAELETVARPLLGYAELRGPGGGPPGEDHLTLLFTAVDHQGRGIARRLLETVTTHLRRSEPPVTALTVNASAYAAPIYARLGFRPTAAAAELDGMPAKPMRLVLDTAADAATGHRGVD